MDSRIHEAYNNMIHSLNLHTDELYALYTASREPLRPLAKLYSLAKLEIDVEIDPDIFDKKGGKAHLETTYDKNVASAEHVKTMVYETGLNGRGIVRLYPVAGHEWTKQEWEDLETLGWTIYAVFSRAKLMNNLGRAKHLDIMTGLLNSSGINRAAGALLRRGYASEDYTSMFLNIKNMKILNRTYGNQVVDKIIRHYAGCVYDGIDPEKELAARLGGDNFFLIILKENKKGILEMLKNIWYTAELDGEAAELHIESRMGIYECDPGIHIEQIMQRTGYAFETARRTAQDIVYYKPEMQERVLHQKWITLVFPEAMARREVVPFYQPKVDAGTRQLVGAEALVRWIRDGKPVSPAEFIPYLENDSLITKVDLYMLEAVCRDLRGWIDMGIVPVRISVNYSRRDFLNKTLAEDTLAILDKYHIDGELIEIEVTESSFYEDFQALYDFTEKMHTRGVAVSMDDFGTGYSSLSMFKNLDFDVVKLDKSFIDTLDSGDSKDEIVVESIATMFTRLHTDIVAEGVETESQLCRVRNLHCNIIQGYFFDRPLPYQDFQERLKRRVYA